MQTQLLTKLFAIACIVAGSFSQCIRKEYHGGPQNTVIKAYETISEQMQAANLNTEVYWLTRNADTIVPEGSSVTEWMFTIIENDANGNPVKWWALVMQITDYCDETFVDQILWIPIDCTTAGLTVATYATVNTVADAVLPSGSFWDWPNDDASHRAPYFCNSANYKSCNILKENFTYFYEIAGNIFAPNTAG